MNALIKNKKTGIFAMKRSANENSSPRTATPPQGAAPAAAAPDRYIIVGNFRSAPDDAADDYTAQPTGVSIAEFYGYMRAYARVHRMLIVDYLDDGIVLRGKAETMRKLARDTEGYYSCVCVSDKAFNEILNLRGGQAMPMSA